ncbi:DNA replication/repair protein RecF [Aureimonas leprariae]|uniref:DNA replication and repair protein RecF n=1 Tax=Plantimonas leprariae TaxID=2615207 RepID=A0A7V7PT38_9HYPH|nr:DNA replication/repair protein RecF [Aureimonas leprariae]KAB0682825.1 DNA replication/repair protein RecF [Aureimonas leprariae]
MAASVGDAPFVGLTSLALTDFRNYAALSIRLRSRFVVLTGDNGAGKTNLMEAVSLLTPGRGLRRASYGETARSGGSGGFSVRAEAEGALGQTRLATFVKPGEDGEGAARAVRIDETVARSADELLDHLRVLWLTPAMDGLFTGPANDRRRFLDRMVLSIDPAHGRRAADYERAMRQRNRLLGEPRADPVWLAGIEEQMAELGVAIALARAELVGLLRAMIGEAPDDAPFPKADLTLDGGYPFPFEGMAASDLETEAARRLAEARGLDARAGRTLEGPHRADLAVFHRAKAMPAALSSTGEQKALLIGLVLAHARLTRAVSGIAPILLLDEIAAHLDPGRRASLFDIVEGLGVQSFMTGTDASLFAALGPRAQHLTVSNGTVAA